MKIVLSLFFIFSCAKYSKSRREREQDSIFDLQFSEAVFQEKPQWEVNHKSPSAISFTSTQKWSVFLKRRLKIKNTKYLEESEYEKISLLAPPSNKSKFVAQELESLKKLKRLRTRDKIDEIRREKSFGGFKFGPLNGYFIDTYSGADEFSDLMTHVVDDVTAFAFFYKNKYNRVRPHFLDEGVEPVIVVPRHPAYPSAHSAQAFIVAMTLSELFPSLRSKFMKDAYRIAKNREVAGVHYPSDTWAGYSLARQYFELIRKKSQFVEDLKLAKKIYLSTNAYPRLSE